MIPFLKNRIVLALAIVALVQTGVLAGMVIDRARLLKTGREIVLPVVPVDPRDFFRGEYVRLGYDISRVPARLLEGPPPHRGAAFYVVLEKQADGTWQPIRLSRTKVQETGPDRIVLKGRSQFGWVQPDAGPHAMNFVRYGIERYFLPQGQGPELEKLATERKIAARIAVDTDGNAAIKGLIVDGVPRYEEPLF